MIIWIDNVTFLAVFFRKEHDSSHLVKVLEYLGSNSINSSSNLLLKGFSCILDKLDLVGVKQREESTLEFPRVSLSTLMRSDRYQLDNWEANEEYGSIISSILPFHSKIVSEYSPEKNCKYNQVYWEGNHVG